MAARAAPPAAQVRAPASAPPASAAARAGRRWSAARAAVLLDELAGFVLARAAAGLSDGTIASDVVMRPAGVPCRLSLGRAARLGWTEGSHRRARSTQPGGH